MSIEKREHAQDGVTYAVITDRTKVADYIELQVRSVDGKIVKKCVGTYIPRREFNRGDNKEG